MQVSTDTLETELERRLDALRSQGLYRQLRRIDSPQSVRVQFKGRTLLNFSSNDYLGLANEPALNEAAIKTIERFGTGAGASRLICGSLAPHHELDEALAQFKGVPAALSFSSGYTAALGTIGALMRKGDTIILDRLIHASLIDAARLSGAKLRVFPHNDLDQLENILRQNETNGTDPENTPRTLIVTESVFSMDGDQAPLPALVALKEKYGAWLMLDEAHATGLFGLHRRGLAEDSGVAERIDIQMGTLGKALGSAGGYICGSRILIDFLINRARSFIFSTAPVPAAAAAATAALHFVQSPAGEERRNQLWANVRALLTGLPGVSGQAKTPSSAIIPLMLGEETKAMDFAAHLLERGIYIPAIRYPTVPRGEARLRLTVTAGHKAPEIQELLAALRSLQFSL